ncbi:lipoprotein [Brumimicrobium oceani]|uniref:DUF4412 domain-containing protein n=1 Tax=Brumimicrobium oceani TaxID=2100725 RepID=A0A2U2XEB4_9FLAO|nr:lipoprotein [Brumimicrobium oceani]PWH86148.1 hypothetical protein DIT68_06230 [Brumimicrobium oceani]
MKKILSFTLLLFLLSACSSPKVSIDNFEGKFIYTISTIEEEVNLSDSTSYQIVYAKDSMLRIDNFTPIGKQIYIKHIPKNKAYILMDVGMKKVAIQTIADSSENAGRYLFEHARGKEKMANRKAKKIRVTDTVYDTTFNMNYLEEIPAKYATAIEGMPGLPARYSINANGTWLNYEINSVEERPLNIDLFGIPSGYEVITLDEFIDLIKD